MDLNLKSDALSFTYMLTNLKYALHLVSCWNALHQRFPTCALPRGSAAAPGK
jgi:hypothetical protein